MSLFLEKFNTEYSSFLNNLNHLFSNNEILQSVNNETDDAKYSRIKKLVNTFINQNDFNNFAKSKIKVFSHKEKNTIKISESVFGKDLSLKKIFNNQSDIIKDLLWKQLHRLVLCVLENENLTDTQSISRIARLKELLKESVSKLDPKETLHNLLKTDKLNNSTNNMINDIFSSFEASTTGKNPLENIFNISNIISDKYKDKIENGEINLNNLLDELQHNLPGMENMKSMIDPILKMQGKPEEPVEPVIIDENFSTGDVQMGKQEEAGPPAIKTMLNALDSTGLMDMLNKGGNSEGQPEGIGKFMSMLTKLQNVDSSNSDEITNIFKNDLGLDMDKINEQMTKMMNSNKE